MSEPASRPTSSAISAYARNARRAVRLQVIVAGLAFVATAVFAILIANQTAELNKVNVEKTAAQSRLKTTDNATQAVLQAASAFASRDPARYERAIKSLRQERVNFSLIAEDLDAQRAEEALVELRNIRVSINRTLAGALFSRPGRSAEELAEAIALEAENLAQPGLPGEDVHASTIALAAYHCEAGDKDAVRALITSAFLAAHSAAAQTGVLPDACREDVLGAGDGGDTPPFKLADADPEFRIRTVYLHIGEESDRAAAQALGAKLCEAGYSVPGIEKVASVRSSELRYYYPQQAPEAEHIASLFAASSSPARWWSAPAVRPLGGFDDLDRHTTEIWLSQSRPMPGASAPAPAAVARFRCAPLDPSAAVDIAAVVAQLTSDNKTDRLAAGQTVANLMRADDDAAMVAALISQLQPPRLEQLSASGRLNVLYMLNLEPSWQPRPEAQALTNALATVRARASQGVAIGGQTNDCLVKLEAKLRGEPAPNTCGGL